jgi:aldose 1-epimerase
MPVMASAGQAAFAAAAPTVTPAVDAGYSATREGGLVRLGDARSATVVSVATDIGNVAVSMTVRGHDVLYFPSSLEAFRSQGGRPGGIPFLGPWANRLDEPAFYANGQRYALDPDLGNLRGGANPIHGFLSAAREWQLVDLGSDAGAAWVTSRLDVYRQPRWMAQWPFAHVVWLTYRLCEGVLEVETRIDNLADEPMPVAIGFHPYFQLTDSTRAEWTASVGARAHYRLTPAKIPTGETEPMSALFADPAAVPLADADLDDVFGDLVRDDEGRAVMTVSGRRQALDVLVGPNYKAVVVWAPRRLAGARAAGQASSPAPPDFICFEPMTGITDALNLAHRGRYADLQSVPARGTWTERFWVRPRGF